VKASPFFLYTSELYLKREFYSFYYINQIVLKTSSSFPNNEFSHHYDSHFPTPGLLNLHHILTKYLLNSFPSILNLKVLQTYPSTCSKYLIDSTQTTLTCGSAHLYTSANLKSIEATLKSCSNSYSILVPSPYKKLAVSFTLDPTSYCVTGGSDVVLFSVL